MNVRRKAAAVAVVVGSFMAPAGAVSGPSFREPAAALRAYRDRQAIRELVRAYRRWLAALRAQSATPFTGPECPGRWAIPTILVRRESACRYDVRNPSSSAGGAYQMVSRSRDWALRASGNEQWVGTPAEYLPPRVQDEAAHALWLNSPCHWAPNPWC